MSDVGLGGHEREHLHIFSSHFSYQLSWDLSKEKKCIYCKYAVEILSWGI